MFFSRTSGVLQQGKGKGRKGRQRLTFSGGVSKCQRSKYIICHESQGYGNERENNDQHQEAQSMRHTIAFKNRPMFPRVQVELRPTHLDIKVRNRSSPSETQIDEPDDDSAQPSRPILESVEGEGR